jgi:hypothetical protein
MTGIAPEIKFPCATDLLLPELTASDRAVWRPQPVPGRGHHQRLGGDVRDGQRPVRLQARRRGRDDP